jgi:5-methyltetrahydropteroyltriglutamate--homocysteine methyltransferase
MGRATAPSGDGLHSAHAWKLHAIVIDDALGTRHPTCVTTPPLRTSVIGSYPFPGWLEFSSRHLDQFGSADISEMQDDAARVAIADQLDAGLDVITDGEQTRFDFNLSFYGFIEGIALEPASLRRFGPPAHDQRGKHEIIGELKAPRGLGAVAEFKRLQRLAGATSKQLKVSVPGPYTLSGRLAPNAQYKDRYAITEALLPIVRAELEALVKAGATEICIDEPSMSCYGWKENTSRFVDLFNRTVEPARGKARLCTHLCFGNFKGHPVGYRKYAPLFPAFFDLHADEVHVEMANREYAELDVIGAMANHYDVAVGIIDVKSYHIETVEQIADAVRTCLRHAPAERLVFAPDCGLSQTARWAAKQKLANMVTGVQRVRDTL